MVERDVQYSMIPRLLNRFDHIEYRLVVDSRDDISQLEDAISNVHKARFQEQRDTMVAEMLAAAPRAIPQAAPAPQVACHRGPGALYAKLPRPLPAGHEAIVDRPLPGSTCSSHGAHRGLQPAHRTALAA